eukprot:12382689-Ditylum_brightwellii.AAC.1
MVVVVWSSRIGREGAQWSDVVEGNGSSPCTAWSKRYSVAYVYLAQEGGGDAVQVITSGAQWTLAWSSYKTGYNRGGGLGDGHVGGGCR